MESGRDMAERRRKEERQADSPTRRCARTMHSAEFRLLKPNPERPIKFVWALFFLARVLYSLSVGQVLSSAVILSLPFSSFQLMRRCLQRRLLLYLRASLSFFLLFRVLIDRLKFRGNFCLRTHDAPAHSGVK